MIKLYARSAQALLAAVLVVALSFTLFACKNDPDEINELVNKNAPQVDKADDVSIIYSESGKAKIRMFTKEFIRNEQATPSYTDMQNGLKIEFFNDSTQIETILTALYGRYYEEQGNVLIRDSVVVINKKGDTLRTEELVWHQDAKKIYSEKFVRINTPDQIMYGNGLEANEDFTWYRILRPKGIVKVDKKGMPE